MRKAITQAKHFPRPELANFYVDFLFDDPSAASGVFIARLHAQVKHLQSPA